MSFKKALLLSAAAVTILVSACGKFLDEKKDAKQPLKEDSQKFECLKQIPQQTNDFIQGTIPPKSIASGIQCASEALQYFSRFNTGSLDNAYTPDDLTKFFGRYFFKQNTLTVDLMLELFKAKKMFLGGSTTSLTKVEIQKFIELLQTLEKPLALLAPHVPQLLIRAESASWEELSRSEAAFTEVLLTVVGHAELMTSQYSFQDLKSLLSEMNKFLNTQGSYEVYNKIQQNTALMESVKNIFIGEPAHFDGLADWEQAVKTLTGLHLEFLRAHYHIGNSKKGSQKKLQAEVSIIDDAFKLLATSLPMKHQGRIPFVHLDTLIDELAAKKYLPLNLEPDSVKNLYKVVILRALDSKRKGDARDLDALERAHFISLRHEWRIFKLHQKFLDHLPFDQKQTVAFEDLVVAAKDDAFIHAAIKELSLESLEQGRLWTSWQEGRELLLKDFPTMYDAEGRAFVVLNPQSYRQSWSSLARWNVVRSLSRLMMRAYGDNKFPELAKNSMAVEGLEQWYTDFHDIGVQIKAFDPRSGNSGARSFKEANFFTFHGDGNSEMSFQETFDFVSLLISGGMVSAEGLRTEMLQRKCGLAELDVFGYPWLKEDCFKDQLRQQIPLFFNNLPGLVTEVKAMSSSEWDIFYSNLMRASRTSDPNGGRVETSDIRTAVMILHYAESLMVVYDRDGNGKLDMDEVRAAAPRFQEFMTKVSPDFVKKVGGYFPTTGSALVEDFFLYLAFRGQKPAAPLSDYLLTFQWEKKRRSLGEVSRAKILQVFKVLKDEASAK